MDFKIDRDTFTVLTTTARYLALTWLAIHAGRQVRQDIVNMANRPSWRDGVWLSTKITLIYWVAGHALGVMFLMWLPGGPVYPRLIAGLMTTLLGGWMGYLEGTQQWRDKDVARKNAEWQKFLTSKE